MSSDRITPAVRPDGVLLLGYAAERWGCGPRLTAVLAELAKAAPVVACEPGPPRAAAHDLAPAGSVRERQVAATPGARQNRAIVDAMVTAGIRSPVLLLVDPRFRHFASRAYGAYRVFALSPRLKEDVAFARDDSAASWRAEDLALWLDRSIDIVLTESPEDGSWIRDNYAYTGICLEADRLLPAPWTHLIGRAAEKDCRPAAFPHRLQILALVDPDSPGSAGREALTAYHGLSRHHVHFAFGRAPNATQAIVATPCYDDFDVVMIDCPDRPDAQWIDGRVAAALRRYRGLKVACECRRGSATKSQSRDWDVHLRVVAGGSWDDGEWVAELDERLSRCMPGLPSWEIHVAGEQLPCDAPTHDELIRKVSSYAVADPRSEEVLEALDNQRGHRTTLLKKIADLQSRKSELDTKIGILERRWKRHPRRVVLAAWSRFRGELARRRRRRTDTGSASPGEPA